ncbi:MAG: FAD:protein FMN transferase [Planctomycetota bacterium]|nr:FAD:protein FMN transferase [Planctomycetota bacterium]
MRILAVLSCVFCLLGFRSTATAESNAPPWTRFEFQQVEMAVPIRIVLYAADAATAEQAAQAAFARIHQLNGVFSDYDETSELRRLCEKAGLGKRVHVSDELWRVLVKAQEVSEKSDGAFDVTCGPLVQLWRRARRLKALPAAERLQAARQLVDYRLVRLNLPGQAVELLKPDMRLDLGGIAKGYVVQDALQVLREHGAPAAMVDAGGDLGLGEPPPGRTGWRIGIGTTDPNGPPRIYLCLSRTAVATSGDMWQYVIIDGMRYSHIVDPRTGVGLTDHSTVTIVAADGTTADALSTAVSVLGPARGLPLVESIPGVAACILRLHDGRLEVHESRTWPNLPIDTTAK